MTPIQPAAIKPLAETLAVLLEDGYEGARNEAASCFGYLMKMVGERPLNAIMDNIAEIRKAKIKEAFEKATVKCKVGTGAPPPRGAPTAAKKPGSKQPKQEKPLEDVGNAKTSAPPKTKTAVRHIILSVLRRSCLTYHIAQKSGCHCTSCRSATSQKAGSCAKGFFQGCGPRWSRPRHRQIQTSSRRSREPCSRTYSGQYII